MNLKEFKEVLNRIPTEYDNFEVSFICEGKERLVTDIENNIEWYEDDMNNNKKMVDITLG
jgi:hypothetical protein